MRWLTLALVSTCVGCSDGASCDDLASWSVAISRGTSDEGADASAMRAADGSLYVAFTDEDVTFGPHRGLAGPHIAHVSADGEILAYAAATGLGPYPYPGPLRENGGWLATMWAGSQPTLALYDDALQPRWQMQLGDGFYNAFALSPAGDVVTVQLEQGPMGQTSTLLYLDVDGQTRWSLPLPQAGVFSLELLDGGDALAYVSGPEGTSIRRYAAADGALVEQTSVAVDALALFPGSTATGPDGDLVVLGFASNGETLSRYAATGELRWSHAFTARSVNNPVFSERGDVLVQTSKEVFSGVEYQVVVLDGGSGEVRVERTSCGYINLVGADEQRYVGLGLTGSSSVGLASFEL